MNNYPRVSDILSPYRPDLDAIPSHILDLATERGSKVHQIVCAKAQKLWVPSIPEECKGYVESWQAWFDRFVEEVILVEHHVVHSVYGYKGTLDLYALLREGLGLSLIDYKTPIQHQKSWQAQISAYETALKHEGHKVDRAGSLQLHPKGKLPKMIWLEDSATAFNAFLAALTARNYFTK